MSRRSMGRRTGGGGPSTDQNLKVLMGLPNLLAFFDPDWKAGVSLRTSGQNRYVTALLDRSGQHTVAQATEANQPLYGALIGGRHAMTFDGGDYLAGATSLATTLAGTAPFTLFMVVKPELQSGNRYPVSFDNDDHQERIALQINADMRLQATRFTGGASSTNSAPTGTMVAGRTDIVSFAFSGTTNTAWLNDGSALGGISGASNTTSAAVTHFILGGGLGINMFTGVLGPVLICSGVLNETDRLAAVHAMMNYWKVGI